MPSRVHDGPPVDYADDYPAELRGVGSASLARKLLLSDAWEADDELAEEWGSLIHAVEEAAHWQAVDDGIEAICRRIRSGR